MHGSDSRQLADSPLVEKAGTKNRQQLPGQSVIATGKLEGRSTGAPETALAPAPGALSDSCPGRPRAIGLCVLFAFSACSATLTRRDGVAYEGTIIESDAESVRVRTDTGSVENIPRADIADIDHPGNVPGVIGTGVAVVSGAVLGGLFAGGQASFAQGSAGTVASLVALVVGGVVTACIGWGDYYDSRATANYYGPARVAPVAPPPALPPGFPHPSHNHRDRSSTATGQPDLPQPAATAATANEARRSGSPPTSAPTAARNAPSAPGYPSYPDATALTAQTIEASPPPGWHTHDGFLLRFQLGPGAGLLSPGSSSVLYGGFAVNIALGWAASPRIVLFAEMGGAMGFPSDSRQSDLAALSTYTVRISYYFQRNLFVGGGIGGGLMGLGNKKDQPGTRSSKMGLGLRFELGQEYWVSTNWALGWALNLAFAAAADKDTSGTAWTGLAFTPAFSISYN